MLNKLLNYWKVEDLKHETGTRYVCTNCGSKVKELFKKYPSSTRLVVCADCGEVADKYIEFETIIILIDLILLSRAAYRHVIFNAESKNLWKLGVIIILLEAYCYWKENFKIDYQPFESEKAFYYAGLQVTFGNFLLFAFIYLLSTPIKWKQIPNQQDLRGSRTVFAMNLLRALILSSIGKFFFLPIVIWKENSTEAQIAIHLSIVIMYFILSLIYAHSVVNYCSRKASCFIVILSFMSKTCISTELDLYIKGQLF